MRGLRSGGSDGADACERWGAGALSRTRHDGGEVAAAELDWGGVVRGGGIQRGVEWGQGVAGVPRVAVDSRRWLAALPRWRAAPLCAGGRGSREGERWKMKGGLHCNF